MFRGMRNNRVKSGLLIGAALFILNACGSNENIYNVTPLPEEVSGIKELPNCTQIYDGEKVYIKELGLTLVCDNENWKDVSSAKSSKSSSSGQNKYGSSSSTEEDHEYVKTDWEYLDHYVDGGTLTDSRDNKKYPTVIVNGKRWMASNLRYIPDGESSITACYKGESENCKTMGPMYNYSVKGVPKITRDNFWDEEDIFETSIFPPSDNICPEGWRLPYSSDWESLIDAAEELNLPEFRAYYLSALFDTTWNLYKDTVIIAGTNRLGFNIKGFPIKQDPKSKGYTINEIADSIPFWYTLYSPYTKSISETSQKSQVTLKPWHYNFINEDNKATNYAFIRCIEKDNSDKYEIKTGTLTDNRYDDVYKIIKIGSLWWMAEDLHFKDNPDDCYPYTINECYYSYNQAMEYPEPNYICPEGWRLPTRLDWFNMFFYVDMYNGKNNAIESVIYTRDSTGKIPSETGLDLKDGESYFTSSTGYYSTGLSSVPIQFLVDISGDHFYYGQANLRQNYASRVRCVKDEKEGE